MTTEAQPFRLHNTLTRKTEDFVPKEPGKASVYVCGMTVYDDAHVGHARAMVVFDAFVRYLRYRGWDVDFVRNFTDVDDKIIKRAAEKGEEPAALAQRFINAFHRDTDALGLARPDAEPRVSESIDKIIGLISLAIEKNHAYPSEGSVWFSVPSFSEYGKLSGQKVDALSAQVEGARSDAASGKRDARDFALWKASKAGEPSWESPWGPGRPGWHIECSAMVWDAFGEQVDIHGGGLDLVFPHHENEIAQSECALGHAPYARYWMHNGLLTMQSGQKMGKSLGNVFNIVDALKVFPAEALRAYYLQVHYRSPLPWGDDSLPDALSLVARLYDAVEVAQALVDAGASSQSTDEVKKLANSLGDDAKAVFELTQTFEERFFAALDEDFNTARALGLACELARAVNRFAAVKAAKKRGGPVAAEALRCFSMVRKGLHLLTETPEAFQEEVKTKRLPALGLSPEDVEIQLAKRADARAAKDWAKADEARDFLEAKGIAVMDCSDGVRWRVRLGD